MLKKLGFRFPDVMLGALVAVALFLLGAAGWSSRWPATQPIETKKADNSAYQQKQKEGWWEREADPLTVITFLLVAVGAGQLGLFWRQLRLIRESLVDAKEAADAAKGAAQAAQDQAKIAERSLTELERPYVFIFDVKEFNQDGDIWEFFVEYSVANYGKMPAIIEGGYIGFGFSDRGTPAKPPLMEDSHTLMTAPILQAGEKREKIREYVPTGMATGGIELDPISRRPSAASPVFNVPEGSDVFFRAIIEYRGPSSREHSTGGLWLANYPDVGQFAQRGGGEYNYVK